MTHRSRTFKRTAVGTFAALVTLPALSSLVIPEWRSPIVRIVSFEGSAIALQATVREELGGLLAAASRYHHGRAVCPSVLVDETQLPNRDRQIAKDRKSYIAELFVRFGVPRGHVLTDRRGGDQIELRDALRDLRTGQLVVLFQPCG